MPSSGKKFRDTLSPCTCSGSPEPVTTNAFGVDTAMSVNTFWRSRTASMRGHDTAVCARPRSGKSDCSCTISPGFAYGNGRRKIVSIMLKIALFAPMPSASASIATSEKTGDLTSERNANVSVFMERRAPDAMAASSDRASGSDDPSRSKVAGERPTDPAARNLPLAAPRVARCGAGAVIGIEQSPGIGHRPACRQRRRERTETPAP
jgi:hypothetical protein